MLHVHPYTGVDAATQNLTRELTAGGMRPPVKLLHDSWLVPISEWRQPCLAGVLEVAYDERI
jgi:hypothetical protein